LNYIYYAVMYLVLINTVTSYRLLKSHELELYQKIIQLILLWLIPIIGVLMVTFFINQHPTVLNKNLKMFKMILKILSIPLFIKIVFKEDKWAVDNSSNQSHVGEGFVDIGSGD